MTALERAVLKRKPVRKFYGYGIVGRSGASFWNEGCVCQDRGPMQETVEGLNDEIYCDEDMERPYRVVRLFYMSRGKR